MDISAIFHAGPNFDFGLGVLNLTDQFPDELQDINATQGGSLAYSESGSVGIRGREFFARTTLKF